MQCKQDPGKEYRNKENEPWFWSCLFLSHYDAKNLRERGEQEGERGDEH